jgi:hypothetical protein
MSDKDYKKNSDNHRKQYERKADGEEKFYPHFFILSLFLHQ